MIDLNVPGMSCGHCVQTVTRTVKQVDPAATVEVDLATRRVRIGSGLPPEAFGRALAEEGYAPKA
jgi:copper chaperone